MHWGYQDSNVIILECIYHTCKQYCLCRDSGGAHIFLCGVVPLLITAYHHSGLDLAFLLLLNEDVAFKDMQFLGINQLVSMHGLKRIAPMELLHFNGDCLLCGLAQLLQGCFH